jgi:hypothetical protein
MKIPNDNGISSFSFGFRSVSFPLEEYSFRFRVYLPDRPLEPLKPLTFSLFAFVFTTPSVFFILNI